MSDYQNNQEKIFQSSYSEKNFLFYSDNSNLPKKNIYYSRKRKPYHSPYIINLKEETAVSAKKTRGITYRLMQRKETEEMPMKIY